MRSDFGRQSPSVLLWFLGLMVGVFVLQSVATTWFGSRAVIEYGALSSQGFRSGHVWTVLTHALLHGGLFHLLINGLGLFFFGRELEAELGPSRFLRLLLISAAGGALIWLGIHFQRPGNVIGASGVLMGLLAVYACLHPRRPIQLLLFFVLPVRVQPIWMVAVLGGIDLIGLLFRELPAGGSLYGIAHSAHLGGLAAGWLFYQLTLARDSTYRHGAAPAIEPPSWLRRRSARPAPNYTVNLGDSAAKSAGAPRPTARPATTASAAATSRDALRAEVDRILDKINLHGFGSLTPAEKRVLDEARQHIHPR
ncbi:MAG: rhomboid family intramembrane serine protease [Opitutaceae bacterium]|nr:rhomboid family intramembrane serine protease [Opitutaceae bacterium]